MNYTEITKKISDEIAIFENIVKQPLNAINFSDDFIKSSRSYIDGLKFCHQLLINEIDKEQSND